MVLFLWILRLISALMILAFAFGIGYLIWRDMQLTVELLKEPDRSDSQLKIIKTAHPKLEPGMIFPLARVTGIGRALDNTIVLDDDYTSNHHALISIRNGQWWLEDLKSRNGIHLNQDKIERPTAISTGDTIMIGSTVFRLELTEKRD